MTNQPKTAVIARQRPRLQRIAPDDIRVGWRLACQNGDVYDVFWGSTKPETLEALLADMRREYGAFTVLDLRDQPEAIRDLEYWGE